MVVYSDQVPKIDSSGQHKVNCIAQSNSLPCAHRRVVNRYYEGVRLGGAVGPLHVVFGSGCKRRPNS